MKYFLSLAVLAIAEALTIIFNPMHNWMILFFVIIVYTVTEIVVIKDWRKEAK